MSKKTYRFVTYELTPGLFEAGKSIRPFRFRIFVSSSIKYSELSPNPEGNQFFLALSGSFGLKEFWYNEIYRWVFSRVLLYLCKVFEWEEINLVVMEKFEFEYQPQLTFHRSFCNFRTFLILKQCLKSVETCVESVKFRLR